MRLGFGDGGQYHRACYCKHTPTISWSWLHIQWFITQRCWYTTSPIQAHLQTHCFILPSLHQIILCHPPSPSLQSWTTYHIPPSSSKSILGPYIPKSTIAYPPHTESILGPYIPKYHPPSYPTNLSTSKIHTPIIHPQNPTPFIPN